MLKMSQKPRNLTIFEGPDGSGKTTLAKKYAEETGALYVHFDAYENIKDIHKFFIEAMQPALMGYQDVVFDRCWHSGPIYDTFHRNLEPEEQRMSSEVLLMLDRAADHCNAVIVNCFPGIDVCITNWAKRTGRELVKSRLVMQGICHAYYNLSERTELPCITWDYKAHGNNAGNIVSSVNTERKMSHANKHHYKVHIMVSSGDKSGDDVMIDIPGVSFNVHSNEYKLATMFGFDPYDEVGNVSTESLVTFIPTNVNLYEYFSKQNFAPSTQVLIGIGPEAAEIVDSFYDLTVEENKNQRSHFVPNIECHVLHNVVADAEMRMHTSMEPLYEFVRDAHIKIATSDDSHEGEEFGCSATTPQPGHSNSGEAVDINIRIEPTSEGDTNITVKGEGDVSQAEVIKAISVAVSNVVGGIYK